MYPINQEDIRMVNLHYNGYVVQRKKISGYSGIEGENWYLNYYSNNSFFEEYYNENIDRAWDNLNYVDCCTDETYIKHYMDESNRMGIEFRILLCATCRKFPIINKAKLVQLGQVLGYDYAYSGGSYYSCILNDIISGRIKEFRKIDLNKNGLFNTYEEAEKFSLFREKIMASNNMYTFEQGDFIIYKLVEVGV